MHTVDWIAIGVVLVFVAIGLLLGFGKLLKAFTGGIVGIIIAIVVTYFCLGVVASWGFVQDLMAKLIVAMQNKNSGFLNFLIKIGVEKIILALALFIIALVLRAIIVSIIKGICEIENPVVKAFNRIFGMLFMLGVLVILTLLIFHIIDLIGGTAEQNCINFLTGVFRLDWVFTHNPLQYIIAKVV